MSDQNLPTSIDFFKLAEQHAQLKGQFSLVSMLRLKDFLADTEGEVMVEANFNCDLTGKSFVNLKIDTTLLLKCERCLESFKYPVAITTLLSPIFENQVLKELQGYEPFLLSKEELVSLQGLVEDEILLALPLVPKHPKAVCPMVLLPTKTTQVESPFAVLSTLKIKK
jgi:uncharacterized protein